MTFVAFIEVWLREITQQSKKRGTKSKSVIAQSFWSF